MENISVKLSTQKFIRQLQAVSKHTEALANELAEIEETTCDKCGGPLEVETLYSDDEVYHKTGRCTDCGEKYVL